MTPGSYYDADNASMVFCCDCETQVPTDRVVCYSCEAHRADGHDSEAYEGETEDGTIVDEWCHGAGPEGVDYDRLQEYPRGRSWAETRAYIIQPRRRRRRRRGVLTW